MQTREYDEYLTKQIVTYIGNKRELLDEIEEQVNYVSKQLKKEKLVCLDLFSGSGIVARMLKSHSSKIMTNDLELYSKVINECFLSNQSELDVQTYWAQNNKSKESIFIINGNFLIEPPSLLRLRKYYIYSPLEDKVLCEKNNSLSLTDKWESGCLLELSVDNNNKEVVKINGKYLNNDNGRLKLELKDVSGFNVYSIPGYADITLLYLYYKVKENDKEVEKTYYLEAKGDDIIIGNEINDRSQFFLIPELKKGEKAK